MKCTKSIRRTQKITYNDSEVDYPEDGFYRDQEITSPCGHLAMDVFATYAHENWYISVNLAFTINATFAHFMIPKASANCKYDHLQFEDTEEQSNIRRFCGKRSPFTVIPNYSFIKLTLDISWTIFATDASFRLFYQVVDKYRYVMPGKADFENIERDSSLSYQFFWKYSLMEHNDHSLYSLHFQVDVGYYISATVDVESLSKNALIEVFDGPSANCYKLKELKSAGFDDSINSVGTSLLLVFYSHSYFADIIITSASQYHSETDQSHMVIHDIIAWQNL
jgi:hypothetical protein